MKLSEKLYILRRQKNWTQEELAGYMDVSRQSVTKWENGQSVPDLNKLIALSALYDVTMDELIKDEIVLPAEKALTGRSHTPFSLQDAFDAIHSSLAIDENLHTQASQQDSFAEQSKMGLFDQSKDVAEDWNSAQSKHLKNLRTIASKMDDTLPSSITSRISQADQEDLHQLNIHEASLLLQKMDDAAMMESMGIGLCTSSPLFLMIALGISMFPWSISVFGRTISLALFSEDQAATIGVGLLLLFVGIGVFLIEQASSLSRKWKPLKKIADPLSPDAEQYFLDFTGQKEPLLHMMHSIGIMCLVLCPIPVITLSIANEALATIGVALLLLLVGIGVWLLNYSSLNKKYWKWIGKKKRKKS